MASALLITHAALRHSAELESVLAIESLIRYIALRSRKTGHVRGNDQR